MGSIFLTLLATTLIGGQSPDTATYADRATRELVARAVARHAQADSSVRDYQAQLRYRLSFGVGTRRWAEVPTAAVEEQDARLSWALPNDLRVDILGRREASQIDGVNLASSFSRPWFVPRTLGDSIRIMGGDSRDRAAPHPLGRGAERLYQYAAGDSLIISMQGKRLVIRAITITPRDDAAIAVAGRLWVDVESGNVVRFIFRYVGRELWNNPEGDTRADSIDARRASRIVSQILTIDADLEYALLENQYWLPRRQVLSGRVTVPFTSIAVPFEATTTFDDYTVNSGRGVNFSVAFRDTTVKRTPAENAARRDSLRAERRASGLPDSLLARDRTGYLSHGGRYQVHRPPVDSLKRYAEWSDSLVLEQDPAERARIRQAGADLAKLVEGLSPELAGRPGAGVAWERFPEMVRFNRVQGTAFSYTRRLPGPWDFTTLYGTMRYGIADHRVMASATMVRDAPSGRVTITGGRDLADVDPWARGLTFGNSMRGLLVGRDDGAYLLAEGARISLERSAGVGGEVMIAAYAADQHTVGTRSRGGLPRLFGADNFYPSNPPIRDGLAIGGQLRYMTQRYRGSAGVNLEGIRVDGEVAGRLTADARQTFLGGAVALRLKAGVAEHADRVPQMALRAGGVETVRGYEFGVATGDALWAAQLDLSQGGRNAVKRVLFLDVGQAGDRRAFGEAKFLSGVGVGFSLLGGLVRADLSHPLTERAGRGLRFDLVFGGLQWP